MNSEFELFPDAASTAAPAVDRLYIFMLGLSLVFTVLIAGLVFYFAIKYRRGNRVDRTQLPTSIRMELSWMILSLPILMFIFLWGAKVCFFLVRPPADTMPITVVPKQWMWKFQHDNGRREIDVLHVPINQPVRLTMISQDVIHSLFVPVFRVKQDVLPGRYTSLWFEATKPGEYRLYCAEYCGTNHSRMIGRVVAQTPGDFAEWLAGDSGGDEPPEVTGAKLFEQFQCATCHQQGGAVPARGPALEDLYMKQVALADGGTAIADEAYLRESILRPTKKLVAGYQPLMPTFEGQIGEEGVLHLIAYIKSLSEESRVESRESSAEQPSGSRPLPLDSRSAGGNQP
ncbi:MAG: cytochrome c oxidase subunit II [Pirellulales bacterium]|nr:cytochrome c oxidase subunit II [Pirellulales bacterium]